MSESYVSLWIIAHQVPLEFSRPEYQRELPFPSLKDLPNEGIEPGSPTLQEDSLLTCCLLFFFLHYFKRPSYLSLRFSGILHSYGYIVPFLLCLSLLFSAICKAYSENHFAFLHLFLGILLVTASCTVL